MFGMTPFNGTCLRSLHLSLRFYDLDHVTTTITTGYLNKFQDGLKILPVRGSRNQPKKFLKKSLMPAFMFVRICEDFSYKITKVHL